MTAEPNFNPIIPYKQEDFDIALRIVDGPISHFQDGGVYIDEAFDMYGIELPARSAFAPVLDDAYDRIVAEQKPALEQVLIDAFAAKGWFATNFRESDEQPAFGMVAQWHGIDVLLDFSHMDCGELEEQFVNVSASLIVFRHQYELDQFRVVR